MKTNLKNFPYVDENTDNEIPFLIWKEDFEAELREIVKATYDDFEGRAVQFFIRKELLGESVNEILRIFYTKRNS